MQDVIQKILARGKGVFALDWSHGTITKQFAKVGLTSTPELNRIYRQMLVSTHNLNKYISGIILHNETVHQKLDSDESFPDYIQNLGIVVGVRADQGSKKYKDTDQDMTIGLPGLDERLKEYSLIGIRFTKWRAGFKISDIYPTKEFLEESVARLVKFVELSHKNNLVPFMEPDVEMAGIHTTTRCAEITTDVLSLLFRKLKESNIDLSKVILKTNMILPGRDSGVIAEPIEVANATLRVLRKSVPPEVPGIVFLSGGLTYDDSVGYLDKIEDLADDNPWKISFSFARALQVDALRVWKGEVKNVDEAQNVLLARLEKASKARKGEL